MTAQPGEAVCFATSWSPDGGRPSSGGRRHIGEDQVLELPLGDMVAPRPISGELLEPRRRRGPILVDIAVIVAIGVAAVLSVLLTVAISHVTLDNAGMDTATTAVYDDS